MTERQTELLLHAAPGPGRRPLTLDQLALTLRRHTGRPVDKSEILRTLIRLADQEAQITGRVAGALDGRANS